MAPAMKRLNVNADRGKKFVEEFNKTLVASGANANDVEVAIRQMSRAFGEGRLQGEELNVLTENAPLVVQRIADFLGLRDESLRAYSKRVGGC